MKIFYLIVLYYAISEFFKIFNYQHEERKRRLWKRISNKKNLSFAEDSFKQSMLTYEGIYFVIAIIGLFTDYYIWFLALFVVSFVCTRLNRRNKWVHIMDSILSFLLLLGVFVSYIYYSH